MHLFLRTTYREMSRGENQSVADVRQNIGVKCLRLNESRSWSGAGCGGLTGKHWRPLDYFNPIKLFSGFLEFFSCTKLESS